MVGPSASKRSLSHIFMSIFDASSKTKVMVKEVGVDKLQETVIREEGVGKKEGNGKKDCVGKKVAASKEEGVNQVESKRKARAR